MPVAYQGIPVQKLVYHNTVTNLASSSNPLDSLRESRVFLISIDMMMSSSLTGLKSTGMRTCFMRKLKMPKQQLNNFEDVFHIFEASQNAKGVSETTLNNYKYNLKKYLKVSGCKKAL